MSDSLDVVDKIFVSVMRLTQQVRLNPELASYAECIEVLANQLSDELDTESPLKLIWTGMTIQSILEELSELVDIALDFEDEPLVMLIDETIAYVHASAFGHTENPTTEEGEEYGS